MDKSKENVMEMGISEHLFDPFLSLDNDLDDVSEVIRNNLFGEHSNLFDSASRTPSPQYYRDTNIFMSSNNMDGDLVFPKNQSNYPTPMQNPVNSYDKEIGEIVSLLQDENPLLSSPGPSTNQQSFDHGFGNLQIKQDYSMMDTNESYDIQPQQVQDLSRIQFASTSTNSSMDYHQLLPQETTNIQLAPYSLYDQPNQLPQLNQQYTPNQYIYEMPRASSSSAIHGMIGELQPVVVDENTLIRPLSDQNLSMYSSYPSTQQQIPQNIHQFGQEPQNDGNTKQELIKMLLEMTPKDFETLRSQKIQQKQRKNLQASSPTPVDPIRKRSSLQLSTSPQPLLVSIGSSPSLESTNGRHTAFSPISPQSSSTSGPMIEWREESDNDEESTLNFNHQPSIRKGPKTERRTAHNLIEKKYRCSINDRINHLKEMLAPEESKLSKSATLRKAIDHILHLRQQNIDLVRENDLLKKSIKALGGEVPLFVNTKYSRHHQTKTSIKIPDDSSSAGSAQSSNSSSPKAKKSSQMMNRSRVSLSIFMFTVLMMNPFAVLFGPQTNELQTPTQNNIIGRIPIHHRTLKSFENEFPFEEANNPQIAWWHRAFTRHAIIWLVNLFIVFIILTRLLVYGEPVLDRRSPTWMTFVKAKKQANDAIAACNYKEAQRQLSDTLYILGRTLPHPGGIDEFLSFAWQVIRHGLNGLWIGRWFSRRRRSKTMPAPAVCRSHASTALVYHQLNQLHLLGIDAIKSGPLTGLNLALSAVNLAESAGISREGITHRQRADIYIHASITTKLSLPRFLSRLVSVYFLQRARRHVRKSATVDGIEMKHYEWVFHPLSQNFFSDIDVLNEILVNSRQMAHFPFSHSYTSPKPIDRLTGAFKMHLLALLMDQLNSSTTTLRLVDFVDISHLLLNICMGDSAQTLDVLEKSNKLRDEPTLGDWESSTKGQSDELCMWWCHFTTCALFWKFGDYSRAQQHYSLIRKCPKPLLTSYLALGAGMALCTRKICMEDQNKKEFVNMVWFHVKESFMYIKKEKPLNPRNTSNMNSAMNQLIRSLTYEWLLNSMLDVWRLNLDSKAQYWEQLAPGQMRQLYREVLTEYTHCGIQADKSKVLAFKVMSRLLDGANPLTTWRFLSKQCTDIMKESEQTSGVQGAQVEIIKRLKEDIQLATNAKISE